MRSFIKFTIISCLAVSTSFAQSEPDTEIAIPKTSDKSLIRYSGVVQFSDGLIERIDTSKMRSPLTYGMAIYEDERLQLSPGSTLKIVTRQECIAVLHGSALALASNREKPWRTKAEAVRWICPEGKTETFVFNNVRFELRSGEVLLEGTKLLLLRGEIRSPKAPTDGFTVRALYASENGSFSLVPGRDESANWELNRSRKPPKESMPWPEPVKEAPPATARLIFGPLGGNGIVGYDVTPLGQEDLNGGGARLQYHRRAGEHGSFIAALTFRELADPMIKESNRPTGRIYNDLAIFLLEAGWRSKHENVFSLYWRAGGGLVYPKISVSRQDIGYASENRYEFYVVSASGGMDAIYCPSWLGSLGIYGGLEGQLIQSIGRGERREEHSYYSTNFPTESHEPWSLTAFTLNAMLGLVYQF